MNEKEAVQRAIEYLTEQLDDEIHVKTEGGGEFMELPCVILSWSTARMERLHGHNPWAGEIRDDNGNVIGEEYHVYHEMRLENWIKTYDDEPITSRESTFGEAGRDELVDDVQQAWVRCEHDPSIFHDDSYEFQVESAVSQVRPTEEPNWFETDQVVSFRYLKRVKEFDVDTLDEVDHDISLEIDFDN